MQDKKFNTIEADWTKEALNSCLWFMSQNRTIYEGIGNDVDQCYRICVAGSDGMTGFVDPISKIIT